MTKIYDDFARLVIERIHGVPYEAAIKNELRMGCRITLDYYRHDRTNELLEDVFLYFDCDNNFFTAYQDLLNKKHIHQMNILGLPITIGRVMQALRKKEMFLTLSYNYENEEFVYSYVKGGHKIVERFDWKLTKENGQECTHTDQSGETILKLTELLTPTKGGSTN